MFRVRIICLMLVCVLALGSTAMAAEVDCDTIYCFTAQDFSSEEALTGVCITQLPDASAGTVLLGKRVLRCGDILTAAQLDQLTFAPLRTQQDAHAQLCYLPIYPNRVEKSAAMTIAIRGKEDKAPVAKDSTMETYKNLPNQGKLDVSDPEGAQLVYTLVRGPKRGEVELKEDGSFTYTPKKNKVGVDSFTFTAADPAGNVSREATVTVQILKPADARQYADTMGQDCRFAAEWMRNTGLFVGEKVNGQECFYPEKEVSQGQFLAMVVELLDIPTEDAAYTDMPLDTPDWLKPYLAAAMRSGLTASLPQAEEADCFTANAPVTGAQAAVILQNALDLSISTQALGMELPQAPEWAKTSLAVMQDNGIMLNAEDALTRAQTAQLLYQVSFMAADAPGMTVFRMQ